MVSNEALQAALQAYYDNDNEYDENFTEAMQAALAAAFPIMLREVANNEDGFRQEERATLREIADTIETVKKGDV